MRKKSLGFLIIIMGIFALKTQAQSSFCGIRNKVITDNEIVNFVVYYNLSAVWVAAGQASFVTNVERLDGKPVFHITGAGKTYKSYDWIYSVNDKYETFIDTVSMLPMKFTRSVKENKTVFNEYVRFAHAQRKAFANNTSYSVPACVQDVLSAVYYARNIDYSRYRVGDKIPFQLYLDKEVHHLYIRYLGKHQITTRYGTFNTIKIKPLLVKGTVFKGGEDMEVYVSDDENRLPVRINSPILVGSVKVDMMSYSGLSYPLRALVKRKK